MRLCLILFGLFAFLGTGKAASSIATINLEKVYNEYWKTGQENEIFKKKKDEALDKIKDRRDDLRKLGEALQRMIKALNDPNLSATERAKRQGQVQLKQREYSQLAEAIKAYENASRKELELEMRKASEEIMGEIQSVVAVKAKEKGYDLVIDKAGKSAAIAPIVVFSAEDNDLTTEVLKQLNLSDPKKGSGGDKK
ncbi:MAG: hypothetical protein CMG71_05345 [Candidatus Marinimicrobia bacterium]|nr:hypothetical protein [Candidatus Neomarinimicrobiota bacterium]|tara:strand:- start:119 stop:706 length:588 start_codon:yes stop_codon:yes gene_type:complete